MIINIPKQAYKCSECESLNCKEYSEPKASEYSGHHEGVVCLDCGHKTRRYVPSIYEQEVGSGASWTCAPNKPREF